jgi:hypothetical protein
MGFQLSPGVVTNEIDLSTVVNGVATTGGALAGGATWGPGNQKVLVDTEQTFVNTFGYPDTDVAGTFLTATSFLQYGNNLTFVRALSKDARNATVTGGGITELVITTPGVGYVHAPTLSFSGGSGTGAAATAQVSGGKIVSVTVTNPGTGYLTTDVISVTVTATGGDTITTPAVLTPFVGLLIKNDTDYEFNFANGQNNHVGEFAAKFAGAAGNGLQVAMCDKASDFTSWAYNGLFTGPPGTSPYVASNGGSLDQIHIVVIDSTGYWTGIPGDVLEHFGFCSVASDCLDSQGGSTYYPNVLFHQSKYVRWMAFPSGGTNWGNLAKNTTFAQLSTVYLETLEGGADGNSTLLDGDIIAAYSEFLAEDFDFALLMTADHSTDVAIYCINNISEYRTDNVTFVSPPYAAVVNNSGNEVTDCVTWRNTLPDSNYAFYDNNWIRKYDRYNDVFRWVPANGDIAGLCVRTDNTRDPWFSPAGLNRGQIKGVQGLAWNARQAYRDVLYQASINPIVQFPGQGTILYGDKTGTSVPSAFSRINVRRLFIVLRKAIGQAAKYILFEFNDPTTRAQFISLVDPFLRDVQGRRGIYAYKVVCDSSNNTQQVIDTDYFRGDIYIQPARSINFITLNFVATRTGIDFSEVVGSF